MRVIHIILAVNILLAVTVCLQAMTIYKTLTETGEIVQAALLEMEFELVE